MSTSGSDGTSTDAAGHDSDNMCKQLGFCTSQASGTDSSTIPDDSMGQLPKRTLERLLRRYPSGQIFNFDAGGDLESSDSSDGEERQTEAEEASANQQRASVGFGLSSGSTTDDRAKQRRLREGALIQQAFPQARSVAFIPVWDTKRDRWLAGGFVYTRVPTRVLTVEGDMSFLRAFANLAATELLNQEVRQADKAKSDALGSLSHELRTPLHGILLGTELLNDTDLDVLQGNLTHTIETCCATLMDTIDHLLDYSKVNDLAMKRRKEAGGSYDTTSSNMSVQPGRKQLFTEVRLDALVEDVADGMYAGHTFKRFPHAPRDPTRNSDTVIRRTNSIPLSEIDSTMYGPWQADSDSGRVGVHLSIDPACDWMFRIEAGAVRRIIMNLLGNALKYTARGSVTVSLTQSESSSAGKRRKNERNVRLVVKDTGKGISDDFLQHELFRPFSQEDDLAPGTGLGLSLVKTIVDGLGGRISVKSAVGVGSTFAVTLPLEQVSRPAEESRIGARDNELFEQQLVDLKGLRVQICGFDDANARSVIESICRDWLHLDVSDDASLAPDLLLWAHDRLITSADSFAQLSRQPHIIICHDAFTAYRRSSECASAGQPGVFEFISQP
jgi:signal transduction histidine kinase